MPDFLPASAASLLSSLRIERAWAFHLESNPSRDMPYHNAAHAGMMLGDLAAMAARRDCLVSGGSLRALALAIAFHDFGHSGGALPDSENIPVALRALGSFCELHPENGVADLRAESERLILATQYPYLPADLSDPAAAAIRDLDLMTVFHLLDPDPAVAELALSQLEGLRAESFPAASGAEFAAISSKFLRAASWHTPFGVERSARLPSALESLSELVRPEPAAKPAFSPH